MKQPLTNSRDEEIILYDMAAMVTLNAQIANGYVSLLTPSKSGKEKKDRENAAYTVAFMALTDGNVVDAAFGLQAYSKDRDHNGSVFCRRAKTLIAEAADTSDAVTTLAVDAYREAFTIVVDTDKKLQKMNFLIRCFFSGRVLRRQRESIQKAFTRLEESIQSST